MKPVPASGASKIVNRAMLIQQEPVIHKGRVNEDSHDGSVRSKAAAKRTLAGARAPARKIECGDDAFLIPQEAVDRIGRVKVESCDLPTWADCEALRTLVSYLCRHPAHRTW